MLTAEIVLERRAASVPDARARVACVLREWGSSPQTVDDAALLVTELVDNAVRHTVGSRIAVHLTCDDRRLRCQVLDENPSLPRRRPAQAGHRPPTAGAEASGTCDIEAVLTEGGRGLLLVEAIASRWGSHTDTRTGWSRKSVWFELPATPSSPEPVEPCCGHPRYRS